MNIQKGIYIENRYEILEKIGSGGMSDVYKTRDIKLNRFVAIKFLKPEFCEDKNFVKNFQIEAQSAAALLHPNVVSVYDVNQTDGTYYIVMEYVDGITLKKYIERNGRLPVKEATSIAIQIAQGIDAAHNAQIVHRDIKPQNVLISREGKIKVTDFGIARTTTANTISSDILGSVQYISPEQARGGQVDNRTDIYSFGIVYYEMVTGQLPFDGDSTVSIALKHIQENVPLVSSIVPGIPNSVSRIIEKCTQRKPDRRYQKMVSLLADLKTSLITPNEDFVVLEPEPSESATIIMSEEDAEILRREGERLLGPDDRTGSYSGGYQSNRHSNYQRQRLSQGNQYIHEQKPRPYQRSGPPQSAGSYSRYRGQASGSDRNRRSRGVSDQTAVRRPRSNRSSEPKKTDRVLVACGIIAGIVIVLLLAVVCITTFSPGNCAGIAPVGATEPEPQTTVTATAEVPSVAGMPEGQARGTLESLGFPVKVLYESSNSLDRDYVIRQSVAGGTTAEIGQEITLTVSSGSDSIVLEDYTGQEKESVVVRLENLGFRVQVTEEEGTGYPGGTVVRTNPAAGSSVTKDTVIEVIVSPLYASGAETTTVVPDVIGYSEENASALLYGSNLTPWITYQEAAGYEGLAYYQEPAAGSVVDAWSQVTVVIGLNPEGQTTAETMQDWIEVEETYVQNQETEG